MVLVSSNFNKFMPVDIQDAPGVVLLGPVTIDISNDFAIPFKIVDSATQTVLLDMTGNAAPRFSTLLAGIQQSDPVKTESLRQLVATWVVKNYVNSVLGVS